MNTVEQDAGVSSSTAEAVAMACCWVARVVEAVWPDINGEIPPPPR
jgi:hypothetical protein